jgi:Uma2 family endonuclease
MATHPQTAIVTLDEFIAAAEATDERLEFVDGQVVALSAPSLEHGLIAENIAFSLRTRLRTGGCRVLSQGNLVAADGSDDTFIPDVAVFCGEAQRRKVRGADVLRNPVVLVEVLSPSTADYDHGRKWLSYRGISSLQHYLLVAQDQPRVEWYTRHGEHFWHYAEAIGIGGEIRLGSLNVALSLAEIYEGVLAADAHSA